MHDIPSLLSLCVSSAASGGAWSKQKRQLERLPEHAADALLYQLVHTGPFLARHLELFQPTVSALVVQGGTAVVTVDGALLAYASGIRHLRTLHLLACPGLKAGPLLQLLQPLPALASAPAPCCSASPSQAAQASTQGPLTPLPPPAPSVARQLRDLSLSGCKGVGREVLPLLAACQNLERLDLSGTGLTGDLALHRLSPALTHLDLGGLHCVDDLACSQLAALTRLAHLALWGAGRLTATGLLLLAFCPHLTHLNLAWSKVELLPALPSLTRLDMQHCELQGVMWPLGAAPDLPPTPPVSCPAPPTLPSDAGALTAPSSQGSPSSQLPAHAAPPCSSAAAGGSPPAPPPLALAYLDLSHCQVAPSALPDLTTFLELAAPRLVSLRCTGSTGLLAPGPPPRPQAPLERGGGAAGQQPVPTRLLAAQAAAEAANADLLLRVMQRGGAALQLLDMGGCRAVLGVTGLGALCGQWGGGVQAGREGGGDQESGGGEGEVWGAEGGEGVRDTGGVVVGGLAARADRGASGEGGVGEGSHSWLGRPLLQPTVQLRALSLAGCQGLSGESLAALVWLKNLQELDLTGCSLDDTALPALACLTSLTALVLDDNPNMQGCLPPCSPHAAALHQISAWGGAGVAGFQRTQQQLGGGSCGSSRGSSSSSLHRSGARGPQPSRADTRDPGPWAAGGWPGGQTLSQSWQGSSFTAAAEGGRWGSRSPASCSDVWLQDESEGRWSSPGPDTRSNTHPGCREARPSGWDLPALEYFSALGTRWSDAGLSELVAGSARLAHLRLSGTALTDAGLRGLVPDGRQLAGCPLRHLELVRCSAITQHGIEPLCAVLETLAVSGSWMLTASVLADLARKSPSLQSVVLDNAQLMPKSSQPRSFSPQTTGGAEDTRLSIITKSKLLSTVGNGTRRAQYPSSKTSRHQEMVCDERVQYNRQELLRVRYAASRKRGDVLLSALAAVPEIAL